MQRGKRAVIREAALGDAEAFLCMQTALDKETQYMMYEPGERTGDIEPVNAMIKRSVAGDDLLLVAESGGDIVGYISAQRGTPRRIRHTAYVITGIRKAFRGQGIGSDFFARLDAWARKSGVTRLELTLICSNEAALRLYEKNGFAIEGTRKRSMFTGGDYADEFYMAKLL